MTDADDDDEEEEEERVWGVGEISREFPTLSREEDGEAPT